MQLKILSFNIWDLPLFFVKDREKRIQGLVRYLKDKDPDIICLQESFDIEHRQFLNAALRSRGYYTPNDFDHTRRLLFFKLFDMTGGLAIFSKFPIRESRFVPYSRFLASAFGEFFARKGFLETVLDTPLGNVRVVNTHLHEETPWPWSEEIRLRQLRRLFAELNRPMLPTILTGDLNEHAIRAQKSFVDLFKSHEYAHPLLHDDAHMTYRPENEYVDFWLNRTKLPKRYDYILVHGIESMDLKVTEYAPEHLTPPLSDHDPVFLTLEKK